MLRKTSIACCLSYTETERKVNLILQYWLVGTEKGAGDDGTRVKKAGWI
jgi:hypothetical protein